MSKTKILGGISRIISFLLVLSVLTSMAAVFITFDSTASAETTEEENPLTLLYNRTYDEGWDLDNGLSVGAAGFAIDKEQTMQYTNNYFWRTSVEQLTTVYTEISFDGHDEIGSVFEFDIKCDDYCDMGRVMYLRTAGGAAHGTVANLFYIKENKASFFSDSGYSFALGNEWATVSIVFDYTSEAANVINVYAYVDGIQVAESTITVKANQSKGVNFIRIGATTELTDEIVGDSFCLDNVKLYSGVNAVTDIPPEMGYGKSVDPGAAKTITIDGQANAILENLEQCLAMKLGVDYFFSKGSRYAILTDESGEAYGAPLKIDGKVMLPLDAILKHTGYPGYYHPDGTSVDISGGSFSANLPIGDKTAVLDGKRVPLAVAPGYATAENGSKYLVMAAEDVEKIFPGWYVTYDDMGLAIVSQVKNLINRQEHLINMTGIMKRFVFDYPTGKEIYDDVNEFTNGFTHPYILTNQAELDSLKLIYDEYLTFSNEEILLPENYDTVTIGGAIQNVVDYVDKIYKIYALPDSLEGFGKYGGLSPEEKPKQPYLANNDGYDPSGGRTEDTEEHAGELQNLAIAYQFTKDVRYAQLAHDLFWNLAGWTHWGHGHILNTADTTASIAWYYDWCYNINVELYGQDDVDRMAQAIFEKTVSRAYNSSFTGTAFTSGEKCLRKQGDASNYVDRPNNWNAVCTSGFGMGALALMNDLPGYDEINEKSGAVLSNNLYNMTNIGLEPYAPDGSYQEGTAYWGYATGVYFRLCMTLDNAVGDDYGLLDCWGMDTTCYFACHTQSSDFRCYSFNDSHEGMQDTNYFYYVANAYNDPALAAIRKTHLENRSNATIYDVLEYPFEIPENLEMPLDYVSYGLDLYTARSDWEQGALFVGIMGGDNNIYGHGDIDAGSFIYDNAGTRWFLDFGSEDYNVPGYWNNATRYRYYKKKPEGHNTVAISTLASIPYGQLLDSTAPIIDYQANEHGSMVVYDMTATLEGAAMSWQRGLLFTNDRKTVVIQDEIALSDIHGLNWFAHFDNTLVSCEIAADGRSAVLTNKQDGTKIRASIVAALSKFKFEIMDCYTFLNTSTKDGTYEPDFAANSGVPEEDRRGFSKLAIRTETLSFNVAVVLEKIESTKDPVQYEWTDMRIWEPGVFEGTAGGGSIVVEETKKRSAPNWRSIRSSASKIETFFGEEDVYSSRLADLYRALTDIKYDMRYYDGKEPGESDTPYFVGLDTLDSYGAEYDGYISVINGVANTKSGITGRIVGYTPSVASDTE